MRRDKIAQFLSVLLALTGSALLFTNCLNHGESSDNTNDPGIMIHLRAGSFDPLKEPLPFPEELTHIRESDREKNYYLAQFRGPIKNSDRTLIEAHQGQILSYIPDFCYLLRIPEQGLEELKKSPRVRWVGEFIPAYKISPPILKDNFLQKNNRRLKLTVQVFKSESLEQVARRALTLGARIVETTSGVYDDYLRLELEQSRAKALAVALAKEPSVAWIEEYVEPALHNDSARWVVQSYQQGQTNLWSKGLTGSGQIIGISDTGVDADMCFFYDSEQGLPGETVNLAQRKIIAYHNWTDPDWDGHDHGTHIAGTILGDDLANPSQPDSYDGIAYNARLIVQDIGYGSGNSVYPPADLNLLFQQAYDDGARIHSNSWGHSVNGWYDTSAQQVDQFIWNHPDFLILFSAGNNGPAIFTINSPATAKNCISVAASENAHPGYNPEDIAGFSSHGPAEDGRIKPTVSAPGDYLISADNDADPESFNCGVRTMSGTSMATPLVAGLSALVRQYFTEGFYPTGSATPSDQFIPSSALIKAVLINSAVNMTGDYLDGPIPSPGQGWGRILLGHTLYFAGESGGIKVVDDTDGLFTGETRNYTYSASGNFPLKITLVWTDYPAMPSASITLVNDLDLKVITPDNITYRGNTFANGQSITGGTGDRRNVEEQVLFLTPEAGDYSIIVEGYNIPEGPQPFALVISEIDTCSYRITSPNGAENWDANSTHEITWTKNDFNCSATVRLDYSTDSGVHWTKITDSAPNNGVYSWDLPNTTTSQARVRVMDSVMPSSNDESNSNFIISPSCVYTILSPNGAERWSEGTLHNILWSKTGSSCGASIKLEYTSNGGATWTTISESSVNTGSFLWTLPNSPTEQARVKLTDLTYPNYSDQSNANFIIAYSGTDLSCASALTLLSDVPYQGTNAGGDYKVGKYNCTTRDESGPEKVFKISTGAVGDIIAREISAKPGLDVFILNSCSPDACAVFGLDSATLQNAAVGTYYIVVDGFEGTEEEFTLQLSYPQLCQYTILSPNGSEQWKAGTRHKIKWAKSGICSANVKLKYSTSGASGPWKKITDATPSDGSFVWTVPDSKTQRARIKIIDADNSNLFDISDHNFTIR